MMLCLLNSQLFAFVSGADPSAAAAMDHQRDRSRIFGWLRQWRQQARNRRTLERLDDRMLRDIGLTREQVRGRNRDQEILHFNQFR
jgi:uncharacterized protein YjiS (DUF1127 family)